MSNTNFVASTIRDMLDQINENIKLAFEEGERRQPYGETPDDSVFKDLVWAAAPAWMKEVETVISAAEATGHELWKNGFDIARIIRAHAIERFGSGLGLSHQRPLGRQLPHYGDFEAVWGWVSHHGWNCGPVMAQQEIFDEMARLARLTGPA